jgi:CRISPR-associated protein Cas5d
MFERRLAKGQQFHQPYLGCREFAADLRPPTGDEQPLPISMAHGLMLYDFRFPTSPERHRDWRPNETPRPLYFDAQLVDGVVAVPPRAAVLERLPEALR